jgi:hypothetical protein
MSETGGGGQTRSRRRRPLRWYDQEFSITSLTDIMTCIVVFLIMNYQCSELTIMPPSGLQLPVSVSQDHPKAGNVMIAYSPNVITADGEKVAELNQGYPSDSDRDGLIINPLLKVLKRNAENSQRNEKYGGAPFGGKMIFQGYDDLPFEFLNSVLYTATLAGYFDFQFVTVHTDKLVAVAGSGLPSLPAPDSSPSPSSVPSSLPKPPPPLPRS